MFDYICKRGISGWVVRVGPFRLSREKEAALVSFVTRVLEGAFRQGSRVIRWHPTTQDMQVPATSRLCCFTSQMQIDGLDLRLRPNFTGTAIRKICTTLGELQDELDDSPIVAPPASAFAPCRFPCPSPIYPQCAVPTQPDVHDTFSRVRQTC